MAAKNVTKIISKIKDSKSIWKILPDLSIKEIEAAITYAADKYYNESNSPFTDEEYDALVDKLREINPKSTVLKTIGAPTKNKRVKLPYWMGSMDKIKSDSVKEFNKWINSYDGPYVISDKLDGISCLLEKKGDVVKLYTRGNGEYGQNISHLLDMVNMSIDDIYDLEEDVSIRGELIMEKKNFEQFAEENPNARNFVGGIVNSKSSSVDTDISAYVDFVAYEIIEPIMAPDKQFKQLKKWNLLVSPNDIYETISLKILDNILTTRKKKSKYEIDGLIITDNKKHKRNQSGNPSYSFAYKGMTPTALVTVKEVSWEVSKDGILAPVVIYDKVRLSGADLVKAYGHNAKYISENNIGKGAIIKIVRSGDVIPYILSVEKPAKNPDMPSVDYYWDDNEVNIYLEDFENNDTVKIKRLTKFAKILGIDNLSEGIITNLYDNGIDTVEKLITVTIDDLLYIDGFQKKLATKIYNNINSALKSLNVLKLMVGSNMFGKGFGQRKIKKILDIYPDIVNQYKKSDHKSWEKKLLDIDGYNVITVGQFLKNLPSFQKFYQEIAQITTVKQYATHKKSTGLFKNEKVVFTGFRDKKWEEFVESEGGKMTSKVSGNTTILVYKDGDTTTGNYTKAAQMGIKLMSKTQFSKKYHI